VLPAMRVPMVIICAAMGLVSLIAAMIAYLAMTILALLPMVVGELGPAPIVSGVSARPPYNPVTLIATKLMILAPRPVIPITIVMPIVMGHRKLVKPTPVRYVTALGMRRGSV